ncbi:MAG TPA: hypothetical protein P5551_02570 [Syntrophales bacterium]|jgi:hypothetical protein|nr:hypothetical protein [Syntrophales bacterium]
METGTDFSFEKWFVDAMMNLAPDPAGIQVDGAPKDMTDFASNKAFSVSFASGVMPGPFGMATILPELAAVTKIQMDLIYKIAKYHQKVDRVNRSLVLCVFAGALGVTAGRILVQWIGSRMIIKTLSTQAAQKIAGAIGTRIGSAVVQRSVGRWLSFATAPVFAYFSRKMTEKIGQYADELLSEDIEIERPGE